jgi:glutathione S-transferase
MSAIEILGAPQSVFVRTTRCALTEKGVPYSFVPAAPHAPEIVEHNPFGKIPVMRHGAFVLFESIAIIGYIDATQPGPTLIPPDPVSAARVMQWTSAIITSVFPAVNPYMRANAMPTGPDGRPDRAIIDHCLPAVRAQLEILAKALDTGHLVAARFSVADMYLLPILAYLRIFPESAEYLVSYASIGEYFDRHATRACFVATAPPTLPGLSAAGPKAQA